MIRRIKSALAAATTTLGTLVLAVAPVGAASAYTLFGDATVVSPGNNSDKAVRLVSDADPGYGGVDYEIADGLNFAGLETLSTDYNITDDDCGAGSPRFQLNIDTDNDGDSDGNVFVYIGPSPNFTDCPTGWQSTGNLIGNTDAGRYDFTQLGGPLGTYDDAPQNVLDGEIVGIQLVVDSGWNENAANGTDGEQTVLADNTVINTDTFDFETAVPVSKDQCKKGGWQSFNGMFKNQGDCVSYVATSGRNPGSGTAAQILNR
jgi:hypothetical protein